MDPKTLTVGLMADPGVPGRVATSIAAELSRELSDGDTTGTPWDVDVNHDNLPLNSDGEVLLVEHARQLREDQEWDYVIYLTELPRSHAEEPLLGEFSPSARAALISLPVLGMGHLRRRTRKLLRAVVLSALHDAQGCPSEEEVRHALGHGKVRRVPPAGTGDISYVVLPGRLNQLRLLCGMVRSNRPGRMVPALSSSIAAAMATGAFGIFYSSIWSMADALSVLRLLFVTVMVVTALSAWLILHNGLWDPPQQNPEPWRAHLDNAATVITVWLSVALMYAILFAGLFVIGLTVIEAGYLQSQLGHPVNLSDYAHLAWLAASLGTLAGALGSNFDSDEAIREATYSRREHQRRQVTDSYSDSGG